MTYKQTKEEIKRLILKKGLENLINADLNEIHDRTGATYHDMQNALNYFRYSPQATKYRA